MAGQRRRQPEIEVGPGQPEKERRSRWPWAIASLAALLVAGTLAFSLRQAGPHTPPSSPVATAAPSAPAETNLPPSPTATVVVAQSPVPPVVLPPPPAPGAIRVNASVPERAAAFFANATKRVRLDTNAWETVRELPHLLARVPPGPCRVRLEVEGFTNRTAEGTNGMPIQVFPSATAEVDFAIAPLPATLHVAVRGVSAGEPVRVRARHILVGAKADEPASARPAKRAQADAIRQELIGGADFETLARERSDCPSSVRGGDLGVFERGRMVKPFEDAAFRLPVGQVSEVVETVFGYHILEVVERHGVAGAAELPGATLVFPATDSRTAAGSPLAVPSFQALTLTVSAPGYRVQALTVGPLLPGAVEQREVTLEREAGSLRVTATVPDYAQDYFGKTAKRLRVAASAWAAVPNLPHTLTNLACGATEVVFSAEGFGVATQRVTVVDARTNDVTFGMTPAPATLTVTCNATQAVARVSSFECPVSRPLSLPSLQALDLTVSATGYMAQVVKLEAMEPGKAYRQEVKLEPVAAAPRTEGTPAPSGRPFENSLGMKFVPVPGTEVLFSVWETRVQDYEAFVQAKGLTWENPGFAQGPTHPAVNVSWNDAKAFCEWLTQKERQAGLISPAQSYRLPADWEWSVAVGLNEARSGTPKDKQGKIQGVYPWGTQWPPPRGTGNYDSSLNVDDFANTAPAGSFTAHRLGLYDMGGNVWEWCEDFFDGQSGARVLRGGSWDLNCPSLLLSSYRYVVGPVSRYVGDGFRCVLVGGSSR